jgi:hypothetical protein
MKFGIVSISYRRTEVLHLFLSSIKRLRSEIGIDFPVVVVGDEEHKDICDNYSVHHITQENHPATRKWNTGVEFLMMMDCEYVIILGSDDIMSTDLLKNLIKEMEKGTDLIGINKVYFYAGDGKFKGTLRELLAPKSILGVARTIRRGIIAQAGTLWKVDKSWGMDHICLRSILPYVKTRAIVEGVLVDVKTHESLNKFTFWVSKIPSASPVKIFHDILGEEEKQLLAQL